MQSINVEDIDDIDSLLDYLHDRFYDLRKIKCKGEVVTIPTSTVSNEPVKSEKGLFKRKKYIVNEAFLHIYNVINYEVVDEANIGEGDFQSIAYDKYRIVINGSVPVKLIADVKSLHMTLEITDKILMHISGYRKNFLRS